MDIFWGMKVLWIFFGVFTKLDYIYGVISMLLGSFLKVKVQNVGYYFGLVKFLIFLGCLTILIFFGGGGGGGER